MLVAETDGHQSSTGLSKVTSETVYHAHVRHVVAQGGIQCESSSLHLICAHIIDMFDIF